MWSDFFWKWWAVLSWKEMYMTCIVKISNTSVGSLEHWSKKPVKFETKWGLFFLELSMHWRVGHSIPRPPVNIWIAGQVLLPSPLLGQSAESSQPVPESHRWARAALAVGLQGCCHCWPGCFGLGLSDTWWNSSNCSVCSWYWEHELLEKVEPCQCVHSSNLPCLGWLLQVEMFLSPVPGLTSCYCLQGSCLCFFLRDQTLVSSLISLPWAPNGLEGFLALLSTLSEMGNFLFWLDYIFVSSI